MESDGVRQQRAEEEVGSCGGNLDAKRQPCQNFDSSGSSSWGRIRPQVGHKRGRYSSPMASMTEEEGEFFDAPDAYFEDSASEDGASLASFYSLPGQDVECELRLQDEILRRTRAEEACASLQHQWDEMSRKFSSIGLSIPTPGCLEGNRSAELEQGLVDIFEQISQMLLIARLVTGSVASGAVKAEKEEELEKVLASKNREIGRLRDKLQYYELLSHEMSQRNQEVIEIVQRRQRRRQRRQQWALGCIAGGLCIGTTALFAWKLFSRKDIKSGI